MMEQTPFRLQRRTLILPLLFQPPGNQQPGQTLIRMLTALRLNLHANPARQVRGPHCRVGFINVLPTRAGRAQSLETNLIRLYVFVGGKAPNADVPVFRPWCGRYGLVQIHSNVPHQRSLKAIAFSPSSETSAERSVSGNRPGSVSSRVNDTFSLAASFVRQSSAFLPPDNTRPVPAQKKVAVRSCAFLP